MAYIGKSPTGTGVRQRYYFTATGGETSLSGSDDNGLTLAFSDGKYVDVMLNGVTLVAGTDYNTSTANTIGGLAALSASDIVEIVVYDIFTVADTVSAKNGGTFSGNVAMNGDLTVDTNTLYVDSANNRVGIGTASPDQTLVVKTADGGGIAIENAAGNQYRWAVNGDDSFAVVDSGTAERMRIDSSGKLLINRTTALSNGYLAINGGAAEAMSIQGGSNNYIVSWHNTSGTLIGSITGSTGSSTSYNTTSDYRLKTAVNYDWDATTRLKQLRPARFEWIADGDDAVPVDGFLAHEVQDVVPEAISGTHNEVDDEGNPVYQGIDQSKLTPLLTKALIEAVEKIEQLETRIAALENV